MARPLLIVRPYGRIGEVRRGGECVVVERGIVLCAVLCCAGLCFVCVLMVVLVLRLDGRMERFGSRLGFIGV